MRATQRATETYELLQDDEESASSLRATAKGFSFRSVLAIASLSALASFGVLSIGSWLKGSTTGLGSAWPPMPGELQRCLDAGRPCADWYATVNTHDCILASFDEANSTADPELAANWERFHFQSSCQIFPALSGHEFHVYWANPAGFYLANTLPIESFLATQDLVTYRHHLTFWYPADSPPPADIIERFSGPNSQFRDFVAFKLFVPEIEVVGTCFEHRDGFPDTTGINMRPSLVSTLLTSAAPQQYSDLVRILLLAKYGGVWVDSDTMLIRDLTPLMRIGALAGKSEMKGIFNNHVLFVGPPGSISARRLEKMSCSIPADSKKWPYSSFEPFVPDWHQNEGVLRACARIGECGISSTPLAVLDGFAWYADGKRLDPCGSYDEEELDFLLAPLFSWHTRLNQHGDYHYNDCALNDPLDDPKAVGIVRRRILQILSRPDWRSPHAIDSPV